MKLAIYSSCVLMLLVACSPFSLRRSCKVRHCEGYLVLANDLRNGNRLMNPKTKEYDFATGHQNTFLLFPKSTEFSDSVLKVKTQKALIFYIDKEDEKEYRENCTLLYSGKNKISGNNYAITMLPIKALVLKRGKKDLQDYEKINMEFLLRFPNNEVPLDINRMYRIVDIDWDWVYENYSNKTKSTDLDLEILENISW